jgi:hypothetical protein
MTVVIPFYSPSLGKQKGKELNLHFPDRPEWSRQISSSLVETGMTMLHKKERTAENFRDDEDSLSNCCRPFALAFCAIIAALVFVAPHVAAALEIVIIVEAAAAAVDAEVLIARPLLGSHFLHVTTRSKLLLLFAAVESVWLLTSTLMMMMMMMTTTTTTFKGPTMTETILAAARAVCCNFIPRYSAAV